MIKLNKELGNLEIRIKITIKSRNCRQKTSIFLNLLYLEMSLSIKYQIITTFLLYVHICICKSRQGIVTHHQILTINSQSNQHVIALLITCSS